MGQVVVCHEVHVPRRYQTDCDTTCACGMRPHVHVVEDGLSEDEALRTGHLEAAEGQRDLRGVRYTMRGVSCPCEAMSLPTVRGRGCAREAALRLADNAHQLRGQCLY